MKSFTLICLMLIAGSTFAGNEKALIVNLNGEITGEIKTEMQIDQLPAGVTKTLDGAKFTGWKPVVVYKVESGAEKFYEITFVRDEEIINLKVNEDGGKIG